MTKNLEEQSHLQAVSDQYDKIWLELRFGWLNEDNLAQHLGYWDENIRTHAESLINMNRAMASRVNLQPGEQVFDAGCGFGGTSLWLAKEYSVHVVGHTISADEVKRADHYALKRGLQKFVRFEQKDYLYSGLPDASFDVVWAQESVCHAPNQQAFLTEAYRLLKPGGRLVMEDCYLFNRPYSQSEMQILQSWFDDMLIPSLPSCDRFVAWAKNTGFENVKLENIFPHILPSFHRVVRILPVIKAIMNIFNFLGLQLNTLSKYHRRLKTQQQIFEERLCFIGIFSAHKPLH